MADYIKINEHSNKGDLGISRKVINYIVEEAIKRIKDAEIVAPNNISFKKDGKVNIEISIAVKKGTNTDSVCLKIQEEIAHDLAIYTESLPFEIIVSINDVK